MEPDTLKKQTCYRESVYILLFPSLSLPLFSLHCLGWQLLDCFTSRSLWPWLLKGKTKAHNLFLQTAIHCACVSGCPSGQYCLDAQLKCESRGQDTTGQDEAWISTQLTEITQTNLLGFPGAKRNPVEDQHTTHLESELGHSHCDKSKRFWHTENKAEFKSQSLPLVIS